MYGRFLRSVREQRGLTQAELARVSGIRQPNISAIERDRRLPSLDTLNRLVVACGFELAAVAGDRVVHCPLPKAGWYPDEQLPERLDEDSGDEAPTVGPDTPLEDRLRLIDAVLAMADVQDGV